MNRARPMAARLKNKPRVNHEPRSAHGRAVNNRSEKLWLARLHLQVTLMSYDNLSLNILK